MVAARSPMRVVGRALERDLVVDEDTDPDRLEQRTHAALVVERGDEARCRQEIREPPGETTAEHDAAQREQLQRDVAGFRTPQRHEPLERRARQRIASAHAVPRDDGRWIAGGDLLRDGGGLPRAFDVAQEAIEVVQARAGDDALPRDVLAELRPQPPQELDLARVPGGEARVSALARERAVATAVPEQARLAEPGARGDEARVADGSARARSQRAKVRGGQGRKAPRAGLEIVDQKDAADAEAALEVVRVDLPRQVRRAGASTLHGSRDAEARGGDRLLCVFGQLRPGVRDELARDVAEARVIAAVVGRLDVARDGHTVDATQSETRVRAADVAGEDPHRASTRSRRAESIASSSAESPAA